MPRVCQAVRICTLTTFPYGITRKLLRLSGTALRAEAVDDAANLGSSSRSRNAEAFRYGITRKLLRRSGTALRAEAVDDAAH